MFRLHLSAFQPFNLSAPTHIRVIEEQCCEILLGEPTGFTDISSSRRRAKGVRSRPE